MRNPTAVSSPSYLRYNKTYRQKIRCRLCGYDSMTMFLDLGFTALADRFITDEQLHQPEITYPLRVASL